jgi:hypothetical protein
MICNSRDLGVAENLLNLLILDRGSPMIALGTLLLK